MFAVMFSRSPSRSVARATAGTTADVGLIAFTPLPGSSSAHTDTVKMHYVNIAASWADSPVDNLGPVRRILPDRPLVPRRAQRLSVKLKSPASLPLSRTAEMSFPSVISLATSARERPHPSAISRTGRTGIRAAKRTETSIAWQAR